MITKEHILHLAKLSALNISQDNLEAAQEKMTSIVWLIQQLDELTLDECMDSVVDLRESNLWRADTIVYDWFWSPASTNVEHDIVDHQIHLKK